MVKDAIEEAVEGLECCWWLSSDIVVALVDDEYLGQELHEWRPRICLMVALSLFQVDSLHPRESQEENADSGGEWWVQYIFALLKVGETNRVFRCTSSARHVTTF